MRALLLCLYCQWAGHRQRPGLLCTLLLSLSLATTAAVSVLMLGDASQQAFIRADNTLQQDTSHRIVQQYGYIDIPTFAALSQRYPELQPRWQSYFSTIDGQRIAITAIDLLPLALTQHPTLNRSALWMSAFSAARLKIDTDNTGSPMLHFADGNTLPVNIIDADWLGQQLVMDLLADDIT